jgi:hypothetical protein
MLYRQPTPTPVTLQIATLRSDRVRQTFIILHALWSSSLSYPVSSSSNTAIVTRQTTILTIPSMSKDDIDNVYLERLDTEDPHMEKRVLRKVGALTKLQTNRQAYQY